MKRHADLKHSRPDPQQAERTARLTRHLDARLRDFAPGGPEVVSVDQKSGRITARFPGHETHSIVEALERRRVEVGEEDGLAVFLLSPDIAFEDLDYVWGCLNELL